MIAEGNIFTPGQLQRFVRVAADPLVLFSAEHPEAGLLFAPGRQDSGRLRPGARPVVQHRLKVQVALAFQAVQQIAEHFRVRIVYRNHHADEPGRGLILPLRLQFLRGRPLTLPPPVIGAKQLLRRFLAQPFQCIGRPVALPVFPDPVNHAHAQSSVFLCYLAKLS